MHFFRAAILSIAALALTASASPVGCSETVPCPPKDCYEDEVCGPACYCKKPDDVSSLLLHPCSKLTCNRFTGITGVLCILQGEEIQPSSEVE